MAHFGLLRRRKSLPADEDAARRFPAEVHVGYDELIGLRQTANQLQLDSRRPARSSIAGSHGSRFRGRGMDYLESRGYQPGDDIRSMDWRITARSGKAHVKVYQEERERPVITMIDLGPGMFFATRGAFKSVVAARAAALIGWAAVRNGDRIGALLFNGGHREIRPTGGQRGVLRLIRELVPASDPRTGTRTEAHSNHLDEALGRLRRVARPGSLVFIFSDFYAMGSETHRHLQQLRKHNDVFACQIVDALEIEPPPPGEYAVTDGEQVSILDSRSGIHRQAYKDFFANHHQAVRSLMNRCAVPLLQLSTSDDVVERLRTGLQNRSLTQPVAPEAVA